MNRRVCTAHPKPCPKVYCALLLPYETGILNLFGAASLKAVNSAHFKVRQMNS
jgi:hypothetical protein